MKLSRVGISTLMLLTFCLVSGLSCAPAGASRRLAPAPAGNPLPAGVLLLVPDDFNGFVYTSTMGASQVRHYFGEHAVTDLDLMLRPRFRSLMTGHVPDEAAAKAMITSGAPFEGFDYVAIPRFDRVDSWNGNEKYGFEIDIVLDLYAADGSTITTIKGHGESSAGVRAPATPPGTGDMALRMAVEAVRDGIDSRQNLFVPRPGG